MPMFIALFISILVAFIVILGSCFILNRLSLPLFIKKSILIFEFTILFAPHLAFGIFPTPVICMVFMGISMTEIIEVIRVTWGFSLFSMLIMSLLGAIIASIVFAPDPDY